MVNFNFLTKNECETMIERKFRTKQFEILDFKIESFSNEKIGFLGDYFRVVITAVVNNVHENVNLFFKRKLSDGSAMSLVSEDGRCYERETFYLELVANKIKKPATWLPSIYLSKDSTFIVLDDLSVRGYAPARNIQLNVESELAHAKQAFKALAKMHAFSITYEEENTIETGHVFRMNEHFGDILFEIVFSKEVKGWQWVIQAIKVVEKLIDISPENHLSPEKFKQLLHEEVNRIIEIMKPSKKYRNILCHGDLWGANVLFKYDRHGEPIDCCLVDFQVVRYVPAMHDIYFYLYLNTSNDFRRQYTNYLLKYYYELLDEELKLANLNVVDIYTWEAFIESGHEFCDAMKIINVMYKTVILLGKEYWEQFFKDTNLLNDFFFYNRDKYVLDFYEKDSNYRAVMNELMVDVRDMFIERLKEV